MSDFLGTVRNISAGRSMLDLYVFDDGIVVGRGDLKAMTLRIAGQSAFGGAGFAAADKVGREAEARRDRSTAATSIEDLVAAHPKNRFIPEPSITAVHYAHPWFPPIYRIDLTLIGGTRERFEWKRLHNEPRAVVALLTRAFGARLTTERI